MVSKQSTRSPLHELAFLSTVKRTAEIGKIVVFIEGKTETAGVLAFAGVLAAQHGARLISVFMQREPAITPAETFARGKGMRSVIEVHRTQLEKIEADYRALFDDIVRRHGIGSDSDGG